MSRGPDESVMRERLKLLVAALALLLTVFFFAPLGVLLLNAGEVAVSPRSVLQLPRWLVLCLWGVFIACALLPSAARRGIACLALGAAALFYLQGNFLVWDYGPLDGTDIDWQAHRWVGWLEVLIWLSAPLLVLYYREVLWRHLVGLSLLLVVVQGASLIAHLGSGKTFPRDGPVTAQEIESDFFAFSGERNVLVIVPDTLALPVFEEALTLYPELEKQLAGFTSFRNTLGVSPFTLLSIPTIISSLVYRNSGTIQAFMSAAFGEQSLPFFLSEQGYKIDIATMGTYKSALRWLPGDDLTSVLYDRPGEVRLRDSVQIWDVTLFRYMPHVLKKRIYDKHKWWLQRHYLSNASSSPRRPPPGDQLMAATPVQRATAIFLDRLAQYVSRDSSQPTFKFIHLFTSHPPFQIDADGNMLLESEYEATPVTERAIAQSAFALKQILGILEVLQQQGIYDQTMVVVAADHGTDITMDTRPVYKRRAHPVLLIKPFGATGELQVSAAPASLLDVPATVTGELGLSAPFAGYALLDDAVPVDRVRQYYYFNWSGKELWDVDRLPFLRQYDVRGPVEALSSWAERCNLTFSEQRVGSCP
ncbi:sulfatase-like hydrolase/transferase [Halioglobus sp.]|nr:sulfatase-like hydrolase/transferase [Halioglobus sp.]